MTLTEMLREHRLVADERTMVIEAAKRIFKKWLKTVGLPLTTGIGKHGTTFDATESTRKLLITLVDEP